MKKRTVLYKLVFLMLLSLFFSQCYINVGFALKPYMIMAFIALLFLFLSHEKLITHFEKIDIIYVFFIIYILLTSIFSQNVTLALRYIGGMLLVFVFYLIDKEIFMKINRKQFENILTNVALIVAFISFGYYFLGLYSFNFSFVGNDINKFGVTMDRQIPRLISLASDDPNITSCFFGLPFCFFLCNHTKFKEKIGLFLYSILILLTLSRGGIFATIIAILYYACCISNKFIRNISNVFKVVLLSIIIIVCTNFISERVFDFSINDLVTSRITSMSTDGGSGRNKLWSYAISAFTEHPIIGIGINNTLVYNNEFYADAHYTHNTYLEVLSELGLMGFIFYMIILYNIYKIMSRYKKSFSFPICFFLLLLVENIFLSMLINELFYFAIILSSMYNRYYLNEKGDLHVKETT